MFLDHFALGNSLVHGTLPKVLNTCWKCYGCYVAKVEWMLWVSNFCILEMFLNTCFYLVLYLGEVYYN